MPRDVGSADDEDRPDEGAEERDPVDEAEEESFPASDPPSGWAGG